VVIDKQARAGRPVKPHRWNSSAHTASTHPPSNTYYCSTQHTQLPAVKPVNFPGLQDGAKNPIEAIRSVTSTLTTRQGWSEVFHRVMPTNRPTAPTNIPPPVGLTEAQPQRRASAKA